MKSPASFIVLFGASLLAGYGFGYLRIAPGRAGESRVNAAMAVDTALSAGGKRFAHMPDAPSAQDIVSALVSATQEQGYLKGRVAMYRLLEQLSPSEIPTILKSIERLPLNSREKVTAALIEHWLKTDPAAAGAWIRSHLTHPAAVAWAHVSPSEALTALINSKHDVTYWNSPKAALDRLAGKDPRARITLLSSFPVGANRDSLLRQEIAELAKTDPAEAYQMASTSLIGQLRTAAIHATLLTWVSADPTTATAQIASMLPELKPGLFGSGFVSEFTRVMARKDPTAALEFAVSLPEEFREYPLIAATMAWAEKEPLSALTWARENGVDITRSFRTERTLQSDNVLKTAMETQPEETINWLITLPPGTEQQQLMKAALQTTMRNPAAKENVLEAGSSIFQLFNALPPEEQAREAGQIGRMIAEKGTFPDDAQWASLFGNEAARHQAMAGAIGTIFSQSPARGDSLLAKLPEGIARDLALKEVAFVQSYATPDQAAQRAMEIQNRDVQRSALGSTVLSWLRRNEAACRAWLDSAEGIPADWIAEWVEIAESL